MADGSLIYLDLYCNDSSKSNSGDASLPSSPKTVADGIVVTTITPAVDQKESLVVPDTEVDTLTNTMRPVRKRDRDSHSGRALAVTIGEDQQNGSASTRKRIKRTLVSPNSGPYLGCVASFVSGHGTGECRAPVGARSKRCEHCDKGDHPRLPCPPYFRSLGCAAIVAMAANNHNLRWRIYASFQLHQELSDLGYLDLPELNEEAADLLVHKALASAQDELSKLILRRGGD